MGLPANEFVHAAKFTGIFLMAEKLEISTFWQKKNRFFEESGTWDAGTKKEMLGRHFCGSSLRCCAAETDSQFIFTPTVL